MYLCINNESEAALPAKTDSTSGVIPSVLDKFNEGLVAIAIEEEGFPHLAAEASFCAEEGVQQLELGHWQRGLSKFRFQKIGIA
jgi:hypothetical protein